VAHSRRKVVRVSTRSHLERISHGGAPRYIAGDEAGRHGAPHPPVDIGARTDGDRRPRRRRVLIGHVIQRHRRRCSGEQHHAIPRVIKPHHRHRLRGRRGRPDRRLRVAGGGMWPVGAPTHNARFGILPLGHRRGGARAAGRATGARPAISHGQERGCAVRMLSVPRWNAEHAERRLATERAPAGGSPRNVPLHVKRATTREGAGLRHTARVTRCGVTRVE
jgi:hypothetical protein